MTIGSANTPVMEKALSEASTASPPGEYELLAHITNALQRFSYTAVVHHEGLAEVLLDKLAFISPAG